MMLALLGLLLALAPLSGDPAVLRAIDADCAARANRANGENAYVSIYDGGGGDGVWRAADAASLRRIARDPDIFSETARVRSSDGRVATVEIDASSLDFSSRTTYCYRPSGTLARAVQESSGTANEDREMRYLDDLGNVIGESSEMGPLASPGAKASPDLRPAKIALFRVVGALPFARLLPPSLLELRASLRELALPRRIVRIDHVPLRGEVRDR